LKAVQESVAQALIEIDAVCFQPQAPITFKSGIISPVYVDNRRLTFHPPQWSIIIDAFQHLINHQNIQIDVIAGVEAAGIPHSAALGYAMQRPSVFVRKQPKEHGTKKRVEGGDISAQNILLIEDLVTTGSSSLDAIRAIRDEGGVADNCACIITYGFPSSLANFEQQGVRLHALTTFDVVLDIALEAGQFSNEDYLTIQDWFTDPTGWAERHGFEGK
jgi:orotate phosphoribosyltransferase